jgi:hypothetical protein
MMTTQKQIRAEFWSMHPTADRRKYPVVTDWNRTDSKQRDFCTDTRCAFVDFVDYLQRDGQISEALANRATL